MLDLEYLLFFGVPGNKVELIEGATPCTAAFPTPALAEAHFLHWAATLARWQQLAAPTVRRDGPVLRASVRGFRLILDGCRIDLRAPLHAAAYRHALSLRYRREYWPGQPPDRPRGPRSWLLDQDIRLGIWSLFDRQRATRGGRGSGHTDLLLTPATCLNPDGFYFGPQHRAPLVEDAWYEGVPDLVIESVQPHSARWDHHERRLLYRDAGVPEYWIADAETETVELHRAGAVATFRAPGHLPSAALQADVPLAKLFHPYGADPHPPRPDTDVPPAWIAPPHKPVGLQQLIITGHPDRRFEYWNARAICVHPFGSPEEAAHRLARFEEEAAAWNPAIFHFRQEGPLVHLEIDVDPALHRQWLRWWHVEGRWEPDEP